MHANSSSVRPAPGILLLASSLVFLLGGCVQMEQALTLNEDGTGTVHMRYSVSQETLAALTPSGAEQAPFAVTEEDIRRDLAVYRPFGVRLLAARVEEHGGGREIEIRLGFDDIRALARTSFFADNRLRLARQEDGRWVLEQHLVPPNAQDMDIDLRPPDQDQNPGFPEGFRAMFTMTMPGRILEANADEVQGRTARWSLGVGGKPGAIRFARGEPMRLVFDGEGLDLPEPQRMSIRLPPPE